MIQIAPSILAADFSKLAQEIESIEQAGIHFLHLDIMDGHFVPNISFGPGIVSTINKLSDAFLDVHLMLAEPERYVEGFVRAGADNITFHLEIHPKPLAMAQQCRAAGSGRVGISINPDMPVERVFPFLEEFDYLLIMSVFPGFGGQKFISDSVQRVAKCREFIEKQKLRTKIEVDGGVDETNASELVSAGADVLVMGTAFFREQNRREFVARMTRKLGEIRAGKERHAR